MAVPLQITYRGIEGTDAIEADVREKAAKLEQFADNIVNCRVVIDVPHKHQHKGKLFTVTVDVSLPGGEVVASRHSDRHHAHEDLYVVIRDAFNAVSRQVEDFVRRRRHDVKAHEEAPRGRIKALFPLEDYGVIETADGREIYFHRNSVSNADFDGLEEGSRVRFSEEPGEKGPQATSVHVERKPHSA